MTSDAEVTRAATSSEDDVPSAFDSLVRNSPSGRCVAAGPVSAADVDRASASAVSLRWSFERIPCGRFAPAPESVDCESVVCDATWLGPGSDSVSAFATEAPASSAADTPAVRSPAPTHTRNRRTQAPDFVVSKLVDLWFSRQSEDAFTVP
jgi:hypothetical protein